jgi:hypothetical protein
MLQQLHLHIVTDDRRGLRAMWPVRRLTLWDRDAKEPGPAQLVGVGCRRETVLELLSGHSGDLSSLPMSNPLSVGQDMSAGPIHRAARLRRSQQLTEQSLGAKPKLARAELFSVLRVHAPHCAIDRRHLE